VMTLNGLSRQFEHKSDKVNHVHKIFWT